MSGLLVRPHMGGNRGAQTTHHLAFSVPSIDERLTLARKDNPNLKMVLDAPIDKVGRYVYVSGVLPGTLVEFIEMGQTRAH